MKGFTSRGRIGFERVDSYNNSRLNMRWRCEYCILACSVNPHCFCHVDPKFNNYPSVHSSYIVQRKSYRPSQLIRTPLSPLTAEQTTNPTLSKSHLHNYRQRNVLETPLLLPHHERSPPNLRPFSAPRIRILVIHGDAAAPTCCARSAVTTL